MGKTPHQIEYDDDDWSCLNIYCVNKNTTPTAIIGKLIYNFLKDNSTEINLLMDEQKKRISARLTD